MFEKIARVREDQVILLGALSVWRDPDIDCGSTNRSIRAAWEPKYYLHSDMD
jgi:hypothetical protein